MSHIMAQAAAAVPNFIASEVGLVLRTKEVADTGVVADAYGNKTVPAGTIYPADDSTAIGIMFTDTDVTMGAAEGSVMVAGRVYEERLTISSDAKSALAAIGIVFETAPEVER